MRIIISPAKKMNADNDSFAPEDLPQFLQETDMLKAVLQGMTDKALQDLWQCNDTIAKLNVERLRTMKLSRNLTPAVLAYEGLQYQYMAPNVFEVKHFAYIRKHLRILSGFYGMLRPFDGVTPYRLEMRSGLSVNGRKDLYDFWGCKLASKLASETGLVLNLASKEYSKAIEPHLPPTVRFLTCTFGELKGGKLLEKGTVCKMARGQMVRWLAENDVTESENIKSFADLGYQFAGKYSCNDNFVFLKKEN